MGRKVRVSPTRLSNTARYYAIYPGRTPSKETGRLFYTLETLFEVTRPVLISIWAWLVLDAYLSARRIEALQRANR